MRIPARHDADAKSRLQDLDSALGQAGVDFGNGGNSLIGLEPVLGH
jgi:hypothetical protein